MSPQHSRPLERVEIERRLLGKLLKVWSAHEHTIQHIAFSPNSDLVISGDIFGKVLLWSLRQQDDNVLGLYTAAYGIGGIHWRSRDSVILADLGGPYFRPHFYQIKLEGIG